MSKFDELKAAAEMAEPIFTDLYGDRYMQGSWSRADLTHEQDAFVAKATPAAILELLAVQAQLVEALKKLTERAMGFNVSGVYFGEMTEDRVILDNACDALAAAGEQS